jgi:hypothetical protein
MAHLNWELLNNANETIPSGHVLQRKISYSFMWIVIWTIYILNKITSGNDNIIKKISLTHKGMVETIENGIVVLIVYIHKIHNTQICWLRKKSKLHKKFFQQLDYFKQRN